MSDTLTNALSQAQHSSTVLQGIMNPTQINPLSGYGNAINLVGGMQGLQAKQGEQLVGQALQQATDENGNLDFAKAQKIASGMGPAAAYAMQGFLKTSSQLRTEQLNNAAGGMKIIGTAAMTVARDPSDANVNASFDNLAANGLPADQVARERARWLAMSPAERQDNAHRVGLQTLDQLHQVIGQTTGVNIGGQIVPLTVGQPTPRGPGSIVQGPGAVTTTASPDTVVGMPDIVVPATADDVKNGLASQPGQMIHISGADRVKRYGYTRLLPPGAQEVPGTGGGGGGSGPGVVGADGKPVSPANPPRLLNVPGTPPAAPSAAPGVPPAPPGAGTAAPPAGGYQGVGAAIKALPTAPAPAATLPVPPVPPANPPPAATVAPAVVQPPPARPPLPPNAPTASLGGGVQVASVNPLLAPAVGTPSPPSPLVAGDVNALIQGMDRARGAPMRGTQVAGASFATGPGYDEQATAKVSQDRLAADDAVAANYASNVFPQTQALSLLGRGMTTGPTTDLINTAKGWAGAVYRSMGGTGAFDSTKEYDSLHKWLSQIVAGNPVAQGSDARLAATLAGNANTGIHELASADMLKAGIAMMRMNATASSEWHSMAPAQQAQYGYYANFLRDFNKNVDPRAFAWDLYNPEQKKTLLDDVNSHDEAYAQKLLNSREMARRNGYLGEIRGMP